MDFLDPRKKRSRQIRLTIAYVLMAMVIILGTKLLVYYANGYTFNRKTGNIIQTGILFIDSKPGGASISLTGVKNAGTTSARLVVPAGTYKLTLTKDGYTSWQRSFVLNENSIARYVYPFLFPLKPVNRPLKNYTATPALSTQSPDRRWILIQPPATGAKAVSFEVFDANNPSQAMKTINLPSGLLTKTSQPGSFKVIEWSSDNDHLLLQYLYDGGNEFIILDRNDPAKSINLNQLLNVSPDVVALQNKKVDNLYFYNQSDQTVKLADVSQRTIGPALISRVLAFKPYGTDLISYLTDKDVAAGEVQARIWNKGRTYHLYTFTAGSQYLIDAAQFQGHWYYVAGSNTAERINIYKDPLNSLKDPSIAKALPLIALHDVGATKVSFSENARFIEAEAGQTFAVYDLETQNYYHYTLADALSDAAVWMDGHRLMDQSDGKLMVMDYDGINRQLVVPTSLTSGGYFSKDFNQLYTFQPDADQTVNFVSTDMRAGVDAPKT